MRLDRIQSADDAAILLDTCLTQIDGWLDGFGKNKFCRIPDFSRRFRALEAQWSRAVPFDTHFITMAIQIASQLREQGRPRWCQGNFAAAQLTAAKRMHPLRFDKAVVSILTLSEIARELDVALPPSQHSIVACGFHFPRLPELIEMSVNDRINNSPISNGVSIDKERSIVLRFLADTAQQETLTVKALAGLAQTDGGKVKKYAASYPTLRALYKALLEFPSCSTEIADVERNTLIRLRKSGDEQMIVDGNEKLLPPEAVTRPPYHWQENPSEPHPPEITVPGNALSWRPGEQGPETQV